MTESATTSTPTRWRRHAPPPAARNCWHFSPTSPACAARVAPSLRGLLPPRFRIWRALAWSAEACFPSSNHAAERWRQECVRYAFCPVRPWKSSRRQTHARSHAERKSWQERQRDSARPQSSAAGRSPHPCADRELRRARPPLGTKPGRDLRERARLHRDRTAWRGDRLRSLAFLRAALGRVRSVVVAPQHQGRGAGRKLIEALLKEARQHAIAQVCLFTRSPKFFGKLGFVAVPHQSLPDKIFKDCQNCPLFTRCDEIAMIYAGERAV